MKKFLIGLVSLGILAWFGLARAEIDDTIEIYTVDEYSYVKDLKTGVTLYQDRARSGVSLVGVMNLGGKDLPGGFYLVPGVIPFAYGQAQSATANFKSGVSTGITGESGVSVEFRYATASTAKTKAGWERLGVANTKPIGITEMMTGNSPQALQFFPEPGEELAIFARTISGTSQVFTPSVKLITAKDWPKEDPGYLGSAQSTFETSGTTSFYAMCVSGVSNAGTSYPKSPSQAYLQASNMIPLPGTQWVVFGVYGDDIKWRTGSVGPTAKLYKLFPVNKKQLMFVEEYIQGNFFGAGVTNGVVTADFYLRKPW